MASHVESEEWDFWEVVLLVFCAIMMSIGLVVSVSYVFDRIVGLTFHGATDRVSDRFADDEEARAACIRRGGVPIADGHGWIDHCEFLIGYPDLGLPH